MPQNLAAAAVLVRWAVIVAFTPLVATEALESHLP
jgi:hypothetical protein